MQRWPLVAAATPHASRSRVVACVAALLLVPAALGAHGDLHARLAHATRAIADRPGDAGRYLTRGELYRAHHEIDRALADYDAALRLAPTLAAARLARGRLLVEAGRAGEALGDLDRFLDGTPQHAGALLARARAHASLGQLDAALHDYDRALTLAPDPDSYLERARTASRLPGGRRRAIAGLEAGLARLGTVPALALEAIAIERRAGLPEDALERLESLAASAGQHPHWLVLRGDLLAEAGRTEDARSAYREARAHLDSLATRRTRQFDDLRTHVSAALRQLDMDIQRDR